MSELQQYQEDLAEVLLLLKEAKRPNNIDYLNTRVKFLEKSIKILQPQPVENPVPISQDIEYHGITKYAWDQEDDKVKIFLNFEGVGSLPKQNIIAEFRRNNFDIRVIGYQGANYRLLIKKTFEDLMEKQCSIRVTNNSVVVTLVKRNQNQWTQILSPENPIEKEREEKEMKKYEKDGPLDEQTVGVIKMMKEMYESGDPEMKQTVKEFMRKTANQQLWKN